MLRLFGDGNPRRQRRSGVGTIELRQCEARWSLGADFRPDRHRSRTRLEGCLWSPATHRADSIQERIPRIAWILIDRAPEVKDPHSNYHEFFGRPGNGRPWREGSLIFALAGATLQWVWSRDAFRRSRGLARHDRSDRADEDLSG